jgi:hypothetical protein
MVDSDSLLDKYRELEQIINRQQLAGAMDLLRIAKEADRRVALIEAEKTKPTKPKKMAV